MKGQAVEEQGGSVGAKGLLDRCAEGGRKARLLYYIISVCLQTRERLERGALWAVLSRK